MGRLAAFSVLAFYGIAFSANATGSPGAGSAPVTVFVDGPKGHFQVVLTDPLGRHPCLREVTFVDPCKLTLSIGPASLGATGSQAIHLDFRVRDVADETIRFRLVPGSVEGYGMLGFATLFSDVTIVIPVFGLGCGIPAALTQGSVRKDILLGCFIPAGVIAIAWAVWPWLLRPPEPMWQAYTKDDQSYCCHNGVKEP